MKRCLIVDDSSSTRKILRHYMESMNFEALEAESREEALEICREDMPDCITVDWCMPDCDGLTLLGDIRALPGADQAKVLYCTSEFDPAHIARALRGGADRCFMKPFDRDVLVRSLASADLL